MAYPSDSIQEQIGNPVSAEGKAHPDNRRKKTTARRPQHDAYRKMDHGKMNHGKMDRRKMGRKEMRREMSCI